MILDKNIKINKQVYENFIMAIFSEQGEIEEIPSMKKAYHLSIDALN